MSPHSPKQRLPLSHLSWPDSWQQLSSKHWSEVSIVVGFLLAALVLFGCNLGGVPLRDWDEGTVAQVAREIWQWKAGFQSWLYPRLWDEPYFNKPPLLHGLIAIAYGWGGVNETMARLPGAILSVISVVMLYGVARELFPSRLPAVLSALIYLTWLPVVRHGRLAMLDGAVLCFALVAIWGSLKMRYHWRWSLVVGLGLGAVGLTKGIVALLFAVMLALFLYWESPQLLRRPMGWLGLSLGLLPAIAWFVAQRIHYDTAFVQVGLLDQSFKRVIATVEGNQGPLWYYGLELLKYAWPWLPFCLGGIARAAQSSVTSAPHRTWARFTLVWCGLYFSVISMMATKLPWYIMPVYPAFALAGGAQLAQLLSEAHHKPYSRWWGGLFGLQFMAAIAGGIVVLTQIPQDLPWLMAIALVLVGTLGLTCYYLTHSDRRFLPTLAIGTYVTLVLLVQSPVWLWELNEDYPVKPIAIVLRQKTPQNQHIYTSFPNIRPALNFYSERQVIPATQAQLIQYWQAELTPYFLIDQATFKQLKLMTAQIVGSAAPDWLVVSKSSVTP